MNDKAAAGAGLDAWLAGWRGWLAAIVLGAVSALGQAPFSLFWLALAGFAGAFLLFQRTPDKRRAFWCGWAIGVGYAAVAMSWIVEPFLVDIQVFGWMAPFALIFMASGFGLFWGAAFAGARWLCPYPGPGLFALAVTWTIAEIVRSYILTGFPWGLVSYIWIDTPVLQYFALIGPQGMNLATLLLVVLAIYAFRSTFRYLALAGVAAALGVLIFVGSIIQSQPPAPGSGPTLNVRMIQPNAPQDQKWDPAMMPVFYNRQLGLTAELSNPAPDVVVWPEVAVPFLLNDPDAPLGEIAGVAGGATVILGGQRREGPRVFNSIAVLEDDGAIAAIYDKYHLVPFGEYLPFQDLMASFGLKSMTARFGSGFSAGPGPQVLDLGRLGKVLPLICYEGIFPHELRRVTERPDWMLLATNDAWFGKLTGPYQHLAQARARSAELGVPMIRVANTGISALIDARGQVVDSLPLGVAGRLDVALPPALPPTLYATAGDLPVFIVLLLALGTLLVRKFALTAS